MTNYRHVSPDVMAAALKGTKQMTNDKDSAVLAERVERVTKWLDGGCSTWGTPMQDIREILNALRQPTQSDIFNAGDVTKHTLIVDPSHTIHTVKVKSLNDGQPTQSDALREENERLRGIVYHYVDPFDIRPEDKDFVEATIAAALVKETPFS